MTGRPVSAQSGEFVVAWRALEGASRRVWEGVARQAGVGLVDFQVLVFLSTGPARPSKAVGEEFGLTSGAVTALVDRLEQAGYLTRQPHPTDRRSSLLVLTPGGIVVVSSAAALFADVADTTITPGRLVEATALFERLAKNLESVRGQVEASPLRG